MDLQQLLAVLAQNQTMLLQMQQQQQQQQQQPQPAANPAGADLATGSGVKVSDPVRYTGTRSEEQRLNSSHSGESRMPSSA